MFSGKTAEKNGKLAHTQSMSQNSPPHQHQTSSSATSVEHPLHHFQQQIQQNHHLTHQSQSKQPEDENKENIRSSEDLEVDDKNSLSSSSSSNDSSSCENSRSSPPPDSLDSSSSSVSSINTTTENQISSPNHQEDQLSTVGEPENESNTAVALDKSVSKHTSEETTRNNCVESTTCDLKLHEDSEPIRTTTPEEPDALKEEPESIKENNVDLNSSSNESKQEPDVDMKTDVEIEETNNGTTDEEDVSVPEGVQIQTTPPLTSNKIADDNTNSSEISSKNINDKAGSDCVVPPSENSNESKESDKEGETKKVVLKVS